MEISLIDLVGNHTLDAVDFTNEDIDLWNNGYTEHCQVIRFRLDGVCYMAIENPDDGYRSSMKSLVICESPNMNNVFPPLPVIGRHRENGAYSEDDILELIDVVTGKTVLEVGTTNVDDYYPCFVAWFNPEGMAHNETTTD